MFSRNWRAAGILLLGFSIFHQFVQRLLQSLRFWHHSPTRRAIAMILVTCVLVVSGHSIMAGSTTEPNRPKVILISLDGAQPDRINQYLQERVLSPNQGLGLLKRRGVHAKQNITCNPSLTAACHTTIGSGSTTSHTDVVANTFSLVTSPLTSTISGFSAPIGGYATNGPAPATNPTAEPIWVKLLASGKKVVTATFPGSDGIDVTVPGIANSPVIQPASRRTVSYTVPFGATAGVFEKGFSLNAANFNNAPDTLVSQLNAAGKPSYSPVKVATLETISKITGGGGPYSLQVAALDTTNDRSINYDTLAFFDANQGIQLGPFSLPSTGPAYVTIGRDSQPFFFEGTPNKVGARFYVTLLAPDLSTVHIARSSLTYIPRNTPVLASVDDINNNVGFWQPQSDYYFVERLASGIDTFSDEELERIYDDQVRNFVDYQTRVALRAITQNPDADLVMVYIEEPDGSEHQFLLTDPRQASNPRNPNSIGAGQDPAKVDRYKTYVRTAYQVADRAVQRIIKSVGTERNGKPRSNIIVVSDHGFTTFHTAVNLNAYLKSKGFDSSQVRAVTSGPAANIYINLQGRELNGTVDRETYKTLQSKLVQALRDLQETNATYTGGAAGGPIFDQIYARPLPGDTTDPNFGLSTSKFIAQDSGDVFATLVEGYNFDGTQNPPVSRLGDDPTVSQYLSVPNFYGAHGYKPTTQEMSASFFAAGPDIGHGTLERIRNIDIAPTINRLLGVESAPTVQGKPINLKP